MHMNYTFDSLTHLGPWFLALAVIAGLFWFFVLATALSRNDFDPVTKFMWVFVIVAASIIGAILYLIIAPNAASVRCAKGDDTSEATECAACLAIIPAGATKCPKCGWSYADAKSQW